MNDVRQGNEPSDLDFTAAQNRAPGAPGIAPRWTSSAKEGVGTALTADSRVWFTLSHGILNEVYYPRVDQACIRDFGLVVSADDGFFSEEKRDTAHSLATVDAGVPAFRLVNRCNQGRYRIEKDVIADPRRDVILQRIRFWPRQTGPEHRVYALLSPHLVNAGARNTAWLGDYKGQPMLFAKGNGSVLALAASLPWSARSVGFVGQSDGWQDLAQHQRLTWTYGVAESGNVALTGQVDLSGLQKIGEPWLFALGFGRTWSEAGLLARSSLQRGFEDALGLYRSSWLGWHGGLAALDRLPAIDEVAPALNTYRVSCAVLRTHESASFPGGIIASLSIPWGADKGDEDMGGYHLVWPRDLAETASGLLACGAHADAVRVIEYLQATQEADGHWPQNSWLDGRAYWRGTQMDECAFPALVVDLALREGVLTAHQATRFWPMVRAAACFILANGPITSQDRWEEDGGYTTFTIAVEIASLLAAADLAASQGHADEAQFLRTTADAWNAQIEAWTYVSGTSLAQQVGVDGYYVRIAPPESIGLDSPVGSRVPIRNRPPPDSLQNTESVVSPDALALVRFGLRRPDDPRILNTLKVIDALLKVEFEAGPCWRRYNGDGYGEHADGRGFDGTGIGRPWPLMTGERAHYELAAGRPERARELLKTFESFASDGALLPEQVWDGADIPERELWYGRPSGSAMPLVWAHSEHIKLIRSLSDARVFDMPPQSVSRYLGAGTSRALRLWRTNNMSRTLAAGMQLRLELLQPATVHWSANNWLDTFDVESLDSPLGLSVVDLPTAELPPGTTIIFTWRTKADGAWLGSNHTLLVLNEISK